MESRKAQSGSKTLSLVESQRSRCLHWLELLSKWRTALLDFSFAVSDCQLCIHLSAAF